MQPLFSFDQDTRVDETLMQTLACQLSCNSCFHTRFLSVLTGGSPGPGGKLASNLTIAYIHIPTNDNPYGLFAFAPNSLDVSVAEDTKPGHKYEATANLTIVRKRGKDRNVGVSRTKWGFIYTLQVLAYVEVEGLALTGSPGGTV